jgi:hypothetical protein
MLARATLFTLLFPASLIACGYAHAQSGTLSVTLSLVDLPTTITLCRDQGAARQYGFDEEWPVLIDIDNNLNTGDPNSSGADVVLLAETVPQTTSCVAAPGVNTQQNLISGVLTWNAAQQAFVNSGAPTSLGLDVAAHTITISTDVAGPLANLSQASRIFLATYATYTPTGLSPTFAHDNSAAIVPNSTVADAAADVLQCAAPCGQNASWIQMIDLVGLSATTSAPLPAFGGNTISVEFDVANLPATLNLCRYPAQFTSGPGFVDSQWLAAFDLDGNPNTGDSGGAEALVVAATPPQAQNCSPNAVATNQATFFADLERWDANLHTFVHVNNLPVTVDTLTSKIVVQVDRTSPALAGLSANSQIGEQTGGLYDSGIPNSPYAYDIGGPVSYGGSYTDPSGDVQNCVSSCTPAVSWYAQIDLVGGSVTLPDGIFHDGFE